LTASQGTAPYIYALLSGDLPGGMSFASDGSLTGVPNISGNFSFTVQARDAYGAMGTQSYVLLITPLPIPIVNPVRMTVFANSSASPVTLNITGAANSVAVATQAVHGTAIATGDSISYTVTAGYSGTDTFTYTASNASGASAPASVTVIVIPPTLSLTPNTLPAGMVGATYSQAVTASQGTVPYTYALLSGSLPGGLHFASDGSITGTPSASGSFSFTIQARDIYGAEGTQGYVLFVAPLPIPIVDPLNIIVLANSSATPVTLGITGTASSVAVVTQAAHGTAIASGTSISYTPTAGYSGTDNFTYTAANDSGTAAPATVAIMVTAPTLVLVPSTLPDGMVGTLYSQSLGATQGTAPYTYTLVSGSLPGGVGLSNSGVLSGTTTTSGSFNFSIQARDFYGATGAQSYALLITPLPAPVANASSITVLANSSFNLVTLNMTGAVTSVAVASQAAHGTASASAGSIFYSPQSGYSGTDVFTYTASNTSGTSTPGTVNVTVKEPTLMLTPSTLITGMAGSAYSQTLVASQGTAPYTYALITGNLPDGIGLGNGGVLAGVPTVSGNFSFMVQARDSYGATGTQSYALFIAPLPVPVANPLNITVLANSSANPVALSITGGVTSVAVATQAVHGTALSSGTSISYSPVAGYSGPDTFSYTATNSSGTSAAAVVDVRVLSSSLRIAPGFFSDAMVGMAYSQSLSASLGTAPYTYALSSGSLPEGLGLSGGGMLTGTPTASGSFGFTIQVVDAYGAAGTQSYVLFVAPLPVPVAKPSSITVFANSSSNVVPLNITGAVTSVAIVTQGTHGVAMASGASIGYTPTAGYSGADMFTYTATNSSGTSATATVMVTVSAPTLVLTPNVLPDGMVGTAYRQSFGANRGTAPYTYAVLSGGLPAGLSLLSEGVLTGTPTSSGKSSFTIQARDTYGALGTQSYALSIDPLPTPLAQDSSLTVQANSNANAVPLNITGMVTSVAVVEQASHGTAAANGSSISYTPTAGFSGKDVFRYTAANASGSSERATVTVTVEPPTLSLSPSILPSGTVGVDYGQHLSAKLGSAPYTYGLLSGSLPAGISLSKDGLLSGVPTAQEVADFTVQVFDAYGAKGQQGYSLVVVIQPPVAGAVSASLPANSTANPIALQLSGGIPNSVAVFSQASHGVAVASGISIAYTPTPGYSGRDTFTYTATNASGTSAAATVTVTVTPPQLSILPVAGPLPDATEAMPYSQKFSASGGTAPYGFALSSGTLPTGLTIAAGGLLTGVPQVHASGHFSFSVGVSDVFGASGTASYTLAVGQMQPVAPSLSVTLAPSGSLELDLTAEARGAPFTGATLLSLTPADAGQASIQRNSSSAAGDAPIYLLRFTSGRSFSGAALVVYTLSNTAGTSAPAQIRIQVLARNDPGKDAEVAGLVAAQAQSASRFAGAQISNVATRMESLHADGWGSSNFGLSLNTGSRFMSGQAAPDGFPMGGYKTVRSPEPSGYGLYASAHNLPDLPGSSQPAVAGKQALAFWVGGSLDYGRQYVRGVETEYRFTSSGISAGGDWRVSDLFTLGLGFGLGRDSSLIGVNGSKSVANSQSMLLYGSLRPAKQMFVDGLLGYGRLRFDSTRTITDSGELATGSRTGSQMFAALVGGMEFRESGWMWSPYMRVELSRTALDSYSESAPGLAALTYFGQKTSALSSVLGVRAEGVYVVGGAKLAPKARLEYTYSLQRTGEARLAYADLADLGAAYSLSSSSTQTGNWTLGLGLRLQWRSGTELSLDLHSSIDLHNNRSQGLSLGLRMPF
jgi:uncharacterized protein YhjY with autotransporter beta-barrel domain